DFGIGPSASNLHARKRRSAAGADSRRKEHSPFPVRRTARRQGRQAKSGRKELARPRRVPPGVGLPRQVPDARPGGLRYRCGLFHRVPDRAATVIRRSQPARATFVRAGAWRRTHDQLNASFLFSRPHYFFSPTAGFSASLFSFFSGTFSSLLSGFLSRGSSEGRSATRRAVTATTWAP